MDCPATIRLHATRPGGGSGTGGFRIAGDDQNTDGVNGATLATDATEDGYALSIDGTTDGIGSSSSLVIDETDADHEMALTIDGLTGTFSAEIVEQDDTGTWHQLASVALVSTGIYNLPYHPMGTVLKLNITNTNTGGSGTSKHIHVLPPSDVALDRYRTVSFTTCNAPRDGYRFGFNGKEKDNEIAGIGNFQDYGFREYDTRIARFNSFDPLAKKFPMLTPYQFASNSPIKNIDLDGLEGYQYLEKTKDANGATTIKRVVEIDVHVAVSANATNAHYKAGDAVTIKANLEKSYNKGFVDASGNTVEFRFNMSEFDADKINVDEYARTLNRRSENFMKSQDWTKPISKATVLDRGHIRNGYQGQTTWAESIINNKANDPEHTQAHEMGHIFLNYDPSVNPKTTEQHSEAGGVFTDRTVDEQGNVIIPTEDVNQKNVDVIIKTLPQGNDVNKENK